MARRLLTLLSAVLAGALLTACRLDVDVLVRLGADGTGELMVTATADADVVARAPGLAEDLRLGDAEVAGWTVEGPTTTEDGGLTVTLRHPVGSAEEATNLLASLGPPFVGVTLQRTADPDDEREVTTTLTGQLQLTGGFQAFADADLIATAGGLPFEEALAGVTPAESMSVRFRAELPGEIEATTATIDGGALVWEAPLDGSSLDVATRAAQRPPDGGSWAGPVSWVALLLLVVWVVGATLAIAAVVRARRRRAARREAIVQRRWP